MSSPAVPASENTAAPAATLPDEDIYLKLQVQFLTALQQKDFPAAFDAAEGIEKRWPGHPNVAFFKEVMEKKVKEVEIQRATGGLRKTREEEAGERSGSEEEEEDDDASADTTGEEGEEATTEDSAAFDDMMRSVEAWEEQLASGDVEAMKETLEKVGILRNERPKP
eukprot:Rhum_TRINITY_DN15061_c6_g1::Rhum_TRINITY_DN15061_c6_g1_i1::g.133585::m.133585